MVNVQPPAYEEVSDPATVKPALAGKSMMTQLKVAVVNDGQLAWLSSKYSVYAPAGAEEKAMVPVVAVVDSDEETYCLDFGAPVAQR